MMRDSVILLTAVTATVQHVKDIPNSQNLLLLFSSRVEHAEELDPEKLKKKRKKKVQKQVVEFRKWVWDSRFYMILSGW